MIKMITVSMAFIWLFTMPNLSFCSDDGLPSLIEFEGSRESGESSVDFKSIYQGRVVFAHGNHVKEYKVECGQCHHDDSGDPLTDLTPGDETNACIDCHYEENLLRGSSLEGVSREERLEHYPNAMHDMCISCHQVYNNQNHTMGAPEACRGCHAKLGK